jgi:hypothetical protein
MTKKTQPMNLSNKQSKAFNEKFNLPLGEGKYSEVDFNYVVIPEQVKSHLASVLEEVFERVEKVIGEDEEIDYPKITATTKPDEMDELIPKTYVAAFMSEKNKLRQQQRQALQELKKEYITK